MNEPYSSPAAPSAGIPQGSGTPYVPPVYYRPTPRQTATSDRRDIVLAVVLLLLAVPGINASLFGGFQLGYTLTSLVITLVSGWYLSRSGQIRPYGAFCLLAMLACTGVFVWHDDRFTRFCLGAGVVCLSMLALTEYTGQKHRDSGTVGCIADVWNLWLLRPLAQVGVSVGAIFRKEQNGQLEKRRCGGVLVGLLCAVPVLAVLIPLLIGADAAFEGLMRLTVLEHLGEWLVSVVLGTALFCVSFSRLYSLRHRLGVPQPITARKESGLEAAPVCTFLGAISVVYIVYLAAQFAYFTNAFSGILPADYTAAQYARRGFFEMCVVCAINLGLTGGCLGLSRKSEGTAPLVTRLFCLFILLFSLGLVAVSAAKMVLYINSFGLTRLRMLTSLFMAMMAVVVVCVMLRLFLPRFPYMRVCVVLIAVIGLTAAYADADTVVSRYNVSAYQDGRLPEVDVFMLSELSDGAVPYLAELMEDPDESVAADAKEAMYARLCSQGRWDETDSDNPVWEPLSVHDWRSYSVDGRRAEKILREFAATDWVQQRQMSPEDTWDDEDTWNDENTWDDSDFA